jgi:hypothetical protein
MASSRLFSIEGKGLKLDTAADVEPYLKPLRDSQDVQEIRLAGNTLGVEASEAIAKVLETKKTLQVLDQVPHRVDSPLTSPGCQFSRHLYITTAVRNSTGIGFSRRRSPYSSKSTHRQPKR